MDSFQGEECRRSGDHDEEEVKTIPVPGAIIVPGRMLSSLELSLAIGQNVTIVPGTGRAQAPFPQ